MSEDSPGSRLAERFHRATAKRSGLHEDELLHELTEALTALGDASDALAVETHDGRRAYVHVPIRESLGGGRRRCQLADLLLVSYAATSPPQVRLTFLQTRRRPGPLPSVEGPLPLARAPTNVYHWDLLHRRPPVEPAGRVRPPTDVLAEARLASVGSFGVFYRPSPDRWSFRFASAGVVQPWGEWPPAAKPRRTAQFPDVTAWRRVEGQRETLAADLRDFGDLLVEGAVGSPLAFGAASEHDRLCGSWLAAVCSGLVRASDAGEAERAAELHELLTGSLEGGGLVDLDSRVGAPPIALVRLG